MDLTLILKRMLLLAMLTLVPFQLLALDVPQLTGRVNDYAGMLSPETAARLENNLAAFEQDQSTQIVVLTIPSLQGEIIEQYAIKVVDQWKIGQKGKDNGVLLILAQAERKVRIEVGMGLQGVLPDITAGQIIRDVMKPFLKANNFDQAIIAGTDAIMSAARGEFTASPQDPAKKTRKHTSPLTLFMLAAVAAVIMGGFSRFLGGVAGAAGLPLAAYLAVPGIGLVFLLILAAAGFLGGLLLSALFSSTVGSGGGGFYMGGGGFGGGGFSSGGDSGFSGGGGGFDGGGASGDW